MKNAGKSWFLWKNHDAATVGKRYLLLHRNIVWTAAGKGPEKIQSAREEVFWNTAIRQRR